MAVMLAEILNEQCVTLELRATARDEALREIIGTMEGRTADGEKFLGEVIAREKSGSTFLGHGVAFPHARSELVSEIVLGIGRSAQGVAFGEGAKRAHLLFVIGVPRRMVSDYLVVVGALARLTKEQKMRTALMSAATAGEFVELLRAGSLLLE